MKRANRRSIVVCLSCSVVHRCGLAGNNYLHPGDPIRTTDDRGSHCTTESSACCANKAAGASSNASDKIFFIEIFFQVDEVGRLPLMQKSDHP